VSASMFIDIPGGRLEAYWHGRRGGRAPVLVFLHEGLGCAAMWRDFPARLSAATGCPALVYSRRGYGASDPCDLPRPIDFMHIEAMQDLPALLTAAGVKAHILVGHSDGASIALIYAGHRPRPGLRGVITEAAHVFCETVTLDSIRDARRRYVDGDLRRRLRRYHGPNTDNAFWGWNRVWLDPTFTSWNIEPGLPAIGVPVLVLQGDRDPYGSLRQVSAIADQVGSRARVQILTDCGHSPHREHPDRCLAVMADFVNGLKTAPASGNP
jgi:pimeloyl-ACP methyl ester carboxylesterase